MSNYEVRSCNLPMADLAPVQLDTCTDGTQCIKVDSIYPHSPAPISEATPDSSGLEVARKLCAEAFGTFILLNVIIGSGKFNNGTHFRTKLSLRCHII